MKRKQISLVIFFRSTLQASRALISISKDPHLWSKYVGPRERRGGEIEEKLRKDLRMLPLHDHLRTPARVIMLLLTAIVKIMQIGPLGPLGS